MFHKGCGMSMISGCYNLDSAHRRCCYTLSPFTDYTTLRLWRPEWRPLPRPNPTTWYTTGIKGILQLDTWS